MNTCEHCRHWDEEVFNGMRIGECRHEKLGARLKPKEFTVDSLFAGETESYPSNPVTGPRFGCVHWEPKGLQV